MSRRIWTATATSVAALLLLGAAQSPGADVPPVVYPALPISGADAAAFVPPGWKLETRADGDLNGDGKPDAALVLRMTDKRNFIPTNWDRAQTYDSNPRMLAILFAGPQGYTLAAADHQLIPRLENQTQDDPFDEIAIAKGTLTVKIHLFMSAGGWEMGGTTYRLRWQDGAMRLIGFDRDSVRRNSGELTEVSINFLTGRKTMTTGTIESDRDRTRTLTIARKPLLKLAEIGDGFLFDPDER